ncbi:hypothetical protein IQ06DRAFT_300220 [Phaeosphaeriaceae sp. SRC1lsM3a]|nr:hypothetical protein IQ06DRAFT_300220 [Stagonospora sp. SRC1lsM3a]
MTTATSENNTSAPPMVHFQAGPSPDSTIVRVTHQSPPDLSYEVRIRPVPTGPSTLKPPVTTHTLSDEPSLIDFPTSTFSFANHGPFSHFLSQHSPSDEASITKVEWEAHDAYDVAGGATLTVAKMLVARLPRLEEVVVRLVMGRREASAPILTRNCEEWVEGLKNLKRGLRVAVLTMERKAFERYLRGGSVRGMLKDVERTGWGEESGLTATCVM